MRFERTKSEDRLKENEQDDSKDEINAIFDKLILEDVAEACPESVQESPCWRKYKG